MPRKHSDRTQGRTLLTSLSLTILGATTRQPKNTTTATPHGPFLWTINQQRNTPQYTRIRDTETNFVHDTKEGNEQKLSEKLYPPPLISTSSFRLDTLQDPKPLNLRTLFMALNNALTAREFSPLDHFSAHSAFVFGLGGRKGAQVSFVPLRERTVASDRTRRETRVFRVLLE